MISPLETRTCSTTELVDSISIGILFGMYLVLLDCSLERESLTCVLTSYDARYNFIIA